MASVLGFPCDVMVMDATNSKAELVEEMVEALIHHQELHRELDATKIRVAELANEIEGTGEPAAETQPPS